MSSMPPSDLHCVMQAIAKLTGLTSLVLAHNCAWETALPGLAALPHLARLAVLELDGKEGLDALAEEDVSNNMLLVL